MMVMATGTLSRIVVRSELSDRYAVAFEGMKMEAKNGQTILNALGLVLLSVQALPEDAYPSAERNREPKP